GLRPRGRSCAVPTPDIPPRRGAPPPPPRRYALFTLVGIAGEDDLDAPDLCEVPPSSPTSRLPSRIPSNGRGRGVTKGESSAILDSEQCATLRDRLLAEIGEIASAERAPSWAQEALAAKNKLAASDAKLIEDMFEPRLSALASP